MKRILSLIGLVAFVPIAVFAYTSPGKPQGFVNDFAHVLSAQSIQALDTQLQVLQDSTGDQIAVVTVPTFGTNETIETYANALFRDWGIGSKVHNNGLLILVAVQDRQARIEVGYGLEGTVTDLQSSNVIQQVMIPAFKTGNYDAGVSGAVSAVTGIITNSPDAVQYSQPINSTNTGSSHQNGNFTAIFFVIIIVLNILARTLGRTKSWWLGGVIGAIIGTVIGLIWGFVLVGFIAIPILTIFGLVFDYIVSKNPPRGGTGGFWPIIFGGGNNGGFGGGGGGFGGFGGGSSGGGGASGRW